MNKILILYPELFNCFSKFSRKIEKILSRLDNFSIVFINDPNQLVKQFTVQSRITIELKMIQQTNFNEISHAIIFDDGEFFNKEIEILKSLDVPIRIIKIKVTRVINIKKEKIYSRLTRSDDYEYIGRGSYWGNPYSMFEAGEDRDEVIRKYKYDFEFDKFPNKKKSEVYNLHGKRLGCHCKPASCHGDVLADYLNSWDDGN